MSFPPCRGIRRIAGKGKEKPDRADPASGVPPACTDLSCPFVACSQATSRSRAPAPGQDLKGPEQPSTRQRPVLGLPTRQGVNMLRNATFPLFCKSLVSHVFVSSQYLIMAYVCFSPDSHGQHL
jgi:hypothetical protein